jgi:hypothetical protein
MESSLKSDSNNAEIYGVQSSVALGRHNFKLGLELANKAILLNPSRPDLFLRHKALNAQGEE